MKKVLKFETVVKRNQSKDQVSNRRVGWSGLSSQELERPGSTLISMLLAEANNRGLQLHELSTAIGVTYGYLAQLRNGTREIAHVSEMFIEACAAFLRLPKLTIRAASGQVKLIDFYELASLEGAVEAAMRYIQQDPQYAGFLPSSFLKMRTDEKLFIVRLYERATGRKLIPGQVDMEDIKVYCD